MTEQGKWLFGGRCLSGSAASSDVRELHIYDFDALGFGCFAKCAMLEEVIIHKPDVHVGDRAFAECHKLRSVTLADGKPFLGSAADNAFFDTPYDAALRSVPFVPDVVASSVLTGSWGGAFLAGLREAIGRMEHDTEYAYDYDYDLGCDEALVSCKRSLYEGYRAGEADLIYLMAQGEFWTGKLSLAYEEAQFGSVLESFGATPVPLPDLYRAAAAQGSVRAKLYLAWLMDIGPKAWLELIGGCAAYPEGLFAQDKEASARLLEQVRQESAPLKSLDIPDLVPILREGYKRLEEAQSEADYGEDYAYDFGDPLPDPSWRELRDRIDGLAIKGCALGATCCVEDACEAYRITHAEAVVVRAEKDAWSAWCRERGVLTNAYLGTIM